ncbi:hypothetical protein AAEQ99_33045, partial [Pseudomonas aeruginosa]
MKSMIFNELIGAVAVNATSVNIKVYRLLGVRWTLDVRTDTGTHRCWDDCFASANSAVSLALKALRSLGIVHFDIHIVD